MEELAKEMLRYRGYKEIEVRDYSRRVLITGREQTQTSHPRPNASCLVVLEKEAVATSAVMQATIKAAYNEAIAMGLHQTSSIVYVHPDKSKGHFRQSIEKARDGIIHQLSSSTVIYFLEHFPNSLFDLDWKKPRATKDWRLEREDNFIIAYLPNGTPIPIDKPPQISYDDVWGRYIGARPGDYISYLRLEGMQVGPMWIQTMAKMSRLESTVIPNEAPSDAQANEANDSGSDVDEADDAQIDEEKEETLEDMEGEMGAGVEGEEEDEEEDETGDGEDDL